MHYIDISRSIRVYCITYISILCLKIFAVCVALKYIWACKYLEARRVADEIHLILGILDQHLEVRALVTEIYISPKFLLPASSCISESQKQKLSHLFHWLWIYELWYPVKMDENDPVSNCFWSRAPRRQCQLQCCILTKSLDSPRIASGKIFTFSMYIVLTMKQCIMCTYHIMIICMVNMLIS